MKKEAVDKIQEFIVKLRTNEKIVNNVIRDDVFSILEKKCTVLYFPLEDDIDGFHTIKNVNGEEEDFVFINSNKKTEKQIFIACKKFKWQLYFNKATFKIYKDAIKRIIVKNR